MNDDRVQNVQAWVDASVRSRADQAAEAVSEARDAVTAALARLEERLRSVGSTLSVPQDLIPPPPQAVSEDASGILAHILRSQGEILAAPDQVGLLTQLLLACTVSCPRVAFFIVRKEAFAGWAARGFEGAQDSDVRGLSIPVDQDTILAAAYRSGAIARGGPAAWTANRVFLSRLGGGEPGDAIAVPIWIRDKIAAVLYGDSGAEASILDPEIPQILGVHAGLCLETLSVRQKAPRPRPGVSASGPQPAVGPSPSVGGTSGAIPAIGDSQPGAAVGPAPATQPGVSSSGGFPRAAFAESGPVVAAPAPQGAAAPARPAAAPPAPSLDHIPEAERKAHEEARRFARLLVSEIVLYNERQVEEGRRNKDLYVRLKEDIDRSLAMYEQRISAKVRGGTNYFYQELVRTLANGDESAVKVPWA